MKYQKISLAVLFLFTGTHLMFSQETKKDTVKAKEKSIEGVQLKGANNKKTETAILGEQRKAIVQKQSIGAEEISRKGISNLEQGLTKITGINTVESRGLFVRGLEERYNSLLVNGLATPSNNPFQKIIELKQFPTDIVGKFDVYKTYNANLYGDFAGATFDIETLVPENSFTKLELSVGVNTLSSFRKNFKINQNANTMAGFIGLNSEDRQLPNEVNGYRPSGKIIPNSSFKDTWNVDNVKSLPNTSLGLTTSQRYKFQNGGSLGFLLNLSQSSEYEYREGNDNTFDTNGEYKNKLFKREYNYNIQSTALLGLSYKKAGTKVDFNGTFLQNSSNQIQDNDGYKDNRPQDILFFRTNQQDISRLTDLQLLVSQKIGDRHQFKAGGSWVNNWFQQPDRKILFGTRTGDNNLLISYGGNNLIRQYLDISGENYFSGMAEYQLGLGKKQDENYYPITFTLGYNGFADLRTMSYRFIFGYTDKPTQDIVNIDRPDSSFLNASNNGKLNWRESDQPNYKSFLYQFVNAGYTSFNYKPTKEWDILAGLRVENNINITRYKRISDNVNGSFNNITKNQYYFLPALSVKKSFENKSNIRFAVSKTITRPILIETLPIEYINPDGNNILGNYEIPNTSFGKDFKGLDNSQNYNLDIKYEIFPKASEIFSINVFGKILDRAIERAFLPSSNSTGTVTTFFNAKQAKIAGLELEGNVSLSRISESLNNWSLGGNFTYLYSEVEKSDAQKGETNFNKKRGLQGAAPWMINADLRYEFKNSNNLKRTASLVYNVSAEKIYAVGFGNLDHVYEKPFHQLDFIIQSELSKKIDVKLGIYNILDQTYRLDMGEDSTVKINASNLRLEDYRKGVSFNLSFGIKF